MHGHSSEVSGTPMHVLDARYAWHSVVPARACMQPWGGRGAAHGAVGPIQPSSCCKSSARPPPACCWYVPPCASSPSLMHHAAILSFSEQHDYKAEADRSAAALESAEEDLKDLKKANQQVSREGGGGDT